MIRLPRVLGGPQWNPSALLALNKYAKNTDKKTLKLSFHACRNKNCRDLFSRIFFFFFFRQMFLSPPLRSHEPAGPGHAGQQCQEDADRSQHCQAPRGEEQAEDGEGAQKDGAKGQDRQAGQGAGAGHRRPGDYGPQKAQSGGW